MSSRIERVGEVTTLSVATTRSNSLRATIPIGIVRQFHLREGDELEWQLQVQNGEMVIVVKPRKKAQ